MEITKKDLLQSLTENQEFDEMAYKQKGVQSARRDPKSGNLKPPKMKPYFHEGNETDIPNAYIKNTNQIPGEEEVLVPLDGNEMDEFIEANKSLLDKLNEIANEKVTLYAGKRLKYHPRNEVTGTKYVPSGEKYSEKESILRKFNPIVNQFVEGVNSHLVKCGLPPIQTYENKAFVDRYSEVTNSGMNWESHDYDFYNSVFDFAKAANDLYLEGSTDVQIYRTHLPRQYNPGSNWSPLRKTEKMGGNFKNNPLTASYKLPKRGYEAEDKDVAVCTTFSIVGSVTYDGGYIWRANLTTSMGKKLKEEQRLNSGNYGKDKDIKKEVRVEVQDSNFDDRRTIMDDGNIREGLINLLNQVRQEILNLDPDQELVNRIKVRQTDITKRMNENELEELVKNTIREIKF